MKFRAVVHVSLKESILDPQGRTVERSLQGLGHDTVRGVRVGKFFQIDMEGERAEVERQLREFSDGFLANPVIETVTFELNEADEAVQ